MYPTNGFSAAPMAFPFSAQPSLYQSQFGGVGGFNPPIAHAYQQAAANIAAAAASRGQSVPASTRQHPPTAGTVAPGPFISARPMQHDQYPPPPAPSQHYEYHSTHGSKSRKHRKQRSASPSGAGEAGVYSDKERRDLSEGNAGRSRSASPSATGRPRQEGLVDNSQDRSIQVNQNEGGKGGVARSEEEQAVGEHERHKSSSKKKKHHRRDRYDNYNAPPIQAPGADVNVYPSQPYLNPAVFGEFQNELPPQLKVHRQPLYSGYNQVYEESLRRGDIFNKQVKRSTRLPPELKEKLLPHEDDNIKQAAQPQSYPYGPAPVYPQQILPGPQVTQPYSVPPSTYNPYQPFIPQTGYYGPTQPPAPAPVPYNVPQPWPNAPAEQEIQRLRSHIHSLEGELHKLQRKLNKTALTGPNEQGEQGGHSHDEATRSHRRSKRDEVILSGQTSLNTEVQHGAGEVFREPSSKKHRHRTASSTSAQQKANVAQQDSSAVQHSGVVTVEHVSGQQTIPSAAKIVSGQLFQHQAAEQRDHSHAVGHSVQDTGDHGVRSNITRNQREETAAQLAHAAAAHVNSRQAASAASTALPNQVTGGAPPPPLVGQSQVSVQQQQQQQMMPPQGLQIRGPAPNLSVGGNIRPPVVGNIRPPVVGNIPPSGVGNIRPPVVGNIPPSGVGNIRPPVGPYRPVGPPQQNLPNQNYNQSNNNELVDTDNDVNIEDPQQEEMNNQSAEKILDAFERFYINRGKSATTPLKVKYIPDGTNSNLTPTYQGNTNNSNRYHSTSQEREQFSSSSSSSSSESIYSSSESESLYPSAYGNNHRTTAAVYINPLM